MRRLLLKYPETTMLAISRTGADTLNRLCVEAKFEYAMPLAGLPGDPESYPENYIQGPKGKILKPTSELIAYPLKIYAGI